MLLTSTFDTLKSRAFRTGRALLLVGPLVVAACGSKESGTTPSDASTETSATDPDGGSVSGRYKVGPYSCCAPGEGRTCCAPETLPDPASGRTATCFQYGGVTGDCTHAGKTYSARDICSKCCDGLKRIEAQEPTESGDCEDNAPPGIFFCAACGDGTCSDGENKCNCPADCHS